MPPLRGKLKAIASGQTKTSRPASAARAPAAEPDLAAAEPDLGESPSPPLAVSRPIEETIPEFNRPALPYVEDPQSLVESQLDPQRDLPRPPVTGIRTGMFSNNQPDITPEQWAEWNQTMDRTGRVIKNVPKAAADYLTDIYLRTVYGPQWRPLPGDE